MENNVHLLDGETIVAIDLVENTRPANFLDPVEALCRLCGVSDPANIGRNGPINASASCETSTDEALKKYETLFGRDSLYAALMLADAYPNLLQATVVRLAELQGTSYRMYAEEEPGRIIHEHRLDDDEVGQEITRTSGWLWPYYGAVDSTPVFVLACQKLYEQDKNVLSEMVTKEDGTVTTIEEACAAALLWTIKKLETSDLFFIESDPQFEGSITNQTWKDSHDSMTFADGAMPELPLSSVEVQGFAYDAVKFGANYFSDTQLGDRCKEATKKLGEQFKKYYLPPVASSLPCVAMGVGYCDKGEVAPLWISGSNIGHLLRGDLLNDIGRSDVKEKIVDELFSDNLLGAAGIRTLGKNEVRYRPGAYHCGQVWLWESAVFALYLADLGYVDKALALKAKVLEACEIFGGYPEFARGDDDAIAFNTHIVDIVDIDGKSNRIEQPPQQIQGWTVAGVVALQASAQLREDIVLKEAC